MTGIFETLQSPGHKHVRDSERIISGQRFPAPFAPNVFKPYHLTNTLGVMDGAWVGRSVQLSVPHGQCTLEVKEQCWREERCVGTREASQQTGRGLPFRAALDWGKRGVAIKAKEVWRLVLPGVRTGLSFWNSLHCVFQATGQKCFQ